MRRLALAAVTATLAGPALAEAPSCFTRAEVAMTLRELGYAVSFVGISAAGPSVVVLTNPDTDQWLMVRDAGPDHVCIVVGGPAYTVRIPGVPS